MNIDHYLEHLNKTKPAAPTPRKTFQPHKTNIKPLIEEDDDDDSIIINESALHPRNLPNKQAVSVKNVVPAQKSNVKVSHISLSTPKSTAESLLEANAPLESTSIRSTAAPSTLASPSTPTSSLDQSPSTNLTSASDPTSSSDLGSASDSGFSTNFGSSNNLTFSSDFGSASDLTSSSDFGSASDLDFSTDFGSSLDFGSSSPDTSTKNDDDPFKTTDDWLNSIGK